METTISLAKEHGLAALTLLGVIWLGFNTNGQFAALQDQINREHTDIRSEMNREHADIREEMNREHAELRGEMYREHTDIRGSIAEVSERLGHVETNLDMHGPNK